jgi:outer membrane protein assembly factor BamB
MQSSRWNQCDPQITQPAVFPRTPAQPDKPIRLRVTPEMKRTILLLTIALFSISPAFVPASTSAQDKGGDWPAFRGSDSRSVVDDENLPVELSDSKNLAWKVELPGRGPASPIIVGDKVFVSCSGGSGEEILYVVCFDAASGKKLWQRQFRATGRCFCHPLSANAAPTPVSDGESIYAFFSSNDLVCLDMDGNLKWFRGLAVDHPKAGHDTGMSSSPVICGDLIICQVENQADSFVTAVRKSDGTTAWEIPRPRDASWSSPVVFQDGNGKPLCLLCSPDRVTVVEGLTGKTVWEKEGRGNPITSASIADGTLYLPIDGTTAVKLNDSGSFDSLWSSSRAAPGSASTVLHDNMLYMMGRGGVVSCFRAVDGERVWQSRVGGQFWSTPLIAGSMMYLFSQEGTVSVVRLGAEGGDDADRIAHTHTFEGEVFLATPAVSNGAIFIRSDKFLYKFTRDPA